MAVQYKCLRNFKCNGVVGKPGQILKDNEAEKISKFLDKLKNDELVRVYDSAQEEKAKKKLAEDAKKVESDRSKKAKEKKDARDKEASEKKAKEVKLIKEREAKKQKVK